MERNCLGRLAQVLDDALAPLAHLLPGRKERMPGLADLLLGVSLHRASLPGPFESDAVFDFRLVRTWFVAADCSFGGLLRAAAATVSTKPA